MDTATFNTVISLPTIHSISTKRRLKKGVDILGSVNVFMSGQSSIIKMTTEVQWSVAGSNFDVLTVLICEQSPALLPSGQQ